MRLPSILALGLALLGRAAAAVPDIAVVPMGNTHEYWKAIHAGALKAERELAEAGTPVHVIWKGPLREDDRDQQIQVVENFMARQVGAIVLAPLDSHALVGPVEEAVAAGIPVVIVDSALHSAAPASFIATDNREGGRIAARRLGALLGGRGKAVMLRCLSGSASTEEREAGFLEVMERDFPGIVLLSTNQHAGATRDTARRAAENLLNRFGGEVNGVFTSNESSSAAMLLALRDAGLAGGKVKFVGFDSGPTLLSGLASGDLQGLVVQNPFMMGYLGVRTAAAVLRGEAVPKVVKTAVILATPENRNDPGVSAVLHPPLGG
jgi:ribose transport system substrate-binding protein